MTNGAYFTSPHANPRQYGADMMAMSADNGGMRILDRRYGSNGLLGSTPQFGNRSHVIVSAGSSFTAADDFNLGNGLGNERQPLGSIGDGLKAAVDGGTSRAGSTTHGDTYTPKLAKEIAWCVAAGWDRGRYEGLPAWPRTIAGAGPWGSTERTASTSRALWYRDFGELAANY